VIASFVDGPALRIFAYTAAASVAVFAARSSQPRALRSFWLGISATMIMLGATRLFGWDHALASLAREDAYQGGWYGGRRAAQQATVAGLALAAAIAFATIFWALPVARGPRTIPTLAILTLSAFVAIRAVSLHSVDSVIDESTLLGIQRGAAIELSLIILVAACACVSVGRAGRARGAPKQPLSPAASRRRGDGLSSE